MDGRDTLTKPEVFSSFAFLSIDRAITRQVFDSADLLIGTDIRFPFPVICAEESRPELIARFNAASDMLILVTDHFVGPDNGFVASTEGVDEALLRYLQGQSFWKLGELGINRTIRKYIDEILQSIKNYQKAIAEFSDSLTSFPRGAITLEDILAYVRVEALRHRRVICETWHDDKEPFKNTITSNIPTLFRDPSLPGEQKYDPHQVAVFDGELTSHSGPVHDAARETALVHFATR